MSKGGHLKWAAVLMLRLSVDDSDYLQVVYSFATTLKKKKKTWAIDLQRLQYVGFVVKLFKILSKTNTKFQSVSHGKVCIVNAFVTLDV